MEELATLRRSTQTELDKFKAHAELQAAEIKTQKETLDRMERRWEKICDLAKDVLDDDNEKNCEFLSVVQVLRSPLEINP